MSVRGEEGREGAGGREGETATETERLDNECGDRERPRETERDRENRLTHSVAIETTRVQVHLYSERALL